jgi:broad specificity phosphatase PhoE
VPVPFPRTPADFALEAHGLTQGTFMSETRVFLLRHGATALNRLVPYRLQGRRSDPELDELGRAQAGRAELALGNVDLAAVYASPLRRALQTAEIVGRPHGRAPIAAPALIEAELGRWEGLTWDEAAAQDPEAHARFLAHPGTEPYPEGESFLDVQRRVTPALAALAAGHDGGAIAVVGHNVVNRAFLAGLLGLPIDAARGLRQANGGINEIRYADGKPTLITLNAELHLQGVAEEVGWML